VDELFAEIDKSLDVGRVIVDEGKSAEGAEWLSRIEEENAGELTPERIAAMEAMAGAQELPMAPAPKTGKRVELDEAASPTAGRRFTRA
jgi:(E)-4-hydroxy-3-methylbut-2-enyl-diphosphate synthase